MRKPLRTLDLRARKRDQLTSNLKPDHFRSRDCSAGAGRARRRSPSSPRRARSTGQRLAPRRLVLDAELAHRQHSAALPAARVNQWHVEPSQPLDSSISRRRRGRAVAASAEKCAICGSPLRGVPAAGLLPEPRKRDTREAARGCGLCGNYPLPRAAALSLSRRSARTSASVFRTVRRGDRPPSAPEPAAHDR